MPIIRNCLECSKEFRTYPCQVKRGGGNFCSKSCCTKYRNKNDNPAWRPEVKQKISDNHADVSGENNPMFGMKGFLSPNFIDGRSYLSKGHYRGKALANLPQKCALCGEEDLNKIDVHHKDGNHKNNDLSNLVLLCKKCHNTKAHIYIRNEKGVFVTSVINKEVVI